MRTLEELVGYKDKNVVITGSASGMAKAATELLIAFGAKVYAIDRNDIDLPVYKSIKGDLSTREGIDSVVSELPEKIDALFMCHGVALIKKKEKLHYPKRKRNNYIYLDPFSIFAIRFSLFTITILSAK